MTILNRNGKWIFLFLCKIEGKRELSAKTSVFFHSFWRLNQWQSGWMTVRRGELLNNLNWSILCRLAQPKILDQVSISKNSHMSDNFRAHCLLKWQWLSWCGVVYYYFITVEETRTRSQLVRNRYVCFFSRSRALCLNVLTHKNTKPFSQQLQWLGTKCFIIAPKGWTIFFQTQPAKPTKIRQNRFV